MSDTLNLFSNQPTSSPFDAIKRTEGEREWWSARDLMPLLGYDRWENFTASIDRAMATAANQNMDVEDLFRGVTKKSSGGRPAADVYLARYAAYLVAMNGDPRKSEVAAAQSYFAIRTREAEMAQPREIAKTEDQKVLEAMQILSARAEAATARVRELEPKADAWDEFLSAEGDVSVNDAAKALSRNAGRIIGGGRLWALLERSRWIYRDATSKPRAYQSQVDAGRLAHRAQTYKHPDTGERVQATPQVRVTAKGLDALRGLLAAAHERKEIAS